MGQFVTSCSGHQGGASACWLTLAPWGFHPRPLGALDIVDTHDQNVHMPPLKNFVPQSDLPMTQVVRGSSNLEGWREWRKIKASQYLTNPLLIKFCAFWKEGIAESLMSSGVLEHQADRGLTG